MHILIVEDSADSRLILKKTLEAEGHRVSEAVHGGEALALARAEAPDLIVSDILMPVMDGFQLCHEVKHDPRLAMIPFVFYTATYVDPEDARLALSLGASRFLIKPLEPDAFLTAMCEVVAQTAHGTLDVPRGPSESEEFLSDQYRESVARKLEAKIRQLETYQGIFHNSDAAVAILTPRGEILRVNPAWEERLGREAGVCKGMRASQFFDGETGVRVDRALSRQEGLRGEPTVEVPGVGRRVFDLSLFSIHDGRAPVSDYVLILRDVTAARRTEAELRRELRVNAAVAGLSTVLIAEKEPLAAVAQRTLEVARDLTGSAQGYVGGVDPKSRALVSRTLAAFLGRQVALDSDATQFEFPPDTDGAYPGLWGYSLNTREPFYANDPATHPAARDHLEGPVPLRRYLSVPVILGDDLVGVIAAANAERDYTERDLQAVGTLGRLFALALQRDRAERRRLALEEQFLQTQKLEAVGRLAGGVAHDFNNLLMVIGGSAELLQAQLGPADPALSRVQDIADAADRAGGLTRQLLAFSRKQVLQPRVVPLSRVVGALEKMLGRLIGEDVRFVLALDEGAPRVRIDPGQLEQVVMNLALNARDAMPDGGSLVIRTGSTHLSASLPNPYGSDVPPGQYATLEVEDTGTGMEPDTLQRVFEPFFTTKPLGQGTGLGLSTVYGIVQQSGGHLTVASEPGRGSTFRVYLPPTAGGEEVALPGPSAPLPRGSETILLVEDEAGVRELLRRQLQALGYRVEEAGDGVEALALAGNPDKSMDLVITDVVMPSMGGVELAERLRASHPDVGVIFTSGYTGAVGSVPEGSRLLQKPFTVHDLAHAVRAALAHAVRAALAESPD
jgi:PAS domain S-box-containing protein